MTYTLNHLYWLLGRGGTLYLDSRSTETTHLSYKLNGVEWVGHGAGIDVAAEWLYNAVKKQDADNERIAASVKEQDADNERIAASDHRHG